MKVWSSTILVSALFWALGVNSGVGWAGIEPPVLRVSSDTEPLTLDWGQARNSSDRFIASFLMRGLLKYDANNLPICDLCKSHEVSADGKVLRFVLKPDERWSDGVPLEAKHFVDALTRGVARSEITSVRADGKDKLEITPSGPHAAFSHRLTTAAAYPVRKELLPSGARAKSDRGEGHASTAVLGAYQLAAWEHGKRVVLEGNPEYKGERPVYRVEFVLGTHAQLLDKFKTGKVDILANPVNDDLMKLPGQKLQVSPYLATRELLFNVKRTQGADQSLRKAILRALDRDALPAFLRNGERPATGLIPPGLPGHRELPLATADVAKVAQERATQPWVELVLLTRDLDADRRVTEWVSAQLEKIRVRIKPRVASPAAFATELKKGAFDLTLRTWTFETASPLDLLRSFGTASPTNPSGWTHVGYDAWLGQLARSTDPAQAAGLVDHMTQLLEVKEVAAIPLGYPTQPFILGPRVQSFAITPFGDPDLVRIRLKQ